MKIFLDTADTQIIREYFETGLIDGVTTNPSLIMKSGRDPEEVYQELKDIGVQDISMEVMGDAQTMLSEGVRLSDKFGSVATIKLPCTREGLLVCKELTKQKVRTNVTLIFCAAQAVLAAKAGATYVSPFVGRLDDQSVAGLEVVRSISELYGKTLAENGMAPRELIAEISSRLIVNKASMRTRHSSVQTLIEALSGAIDSSLSK